MKNKMSFRKLLVRVFAAFFTFYIVIMGIFTLIQYQSSKNECESRRGNFIASLERWMKFSAEFSKIDEEEHAPLSYLWTITRDSFCTKENYIRAALYTENGECVARTGNFIACSQTIVENYQGKEKNQSTYSLLDMEKYLSFEQITYLGELMQKESGTIRYNLKVEGYKAKGEIIPEKITIFKETFEQTGKNTAKLIRNESIEEYTFTVKNVEGLEKYESRNCTLLAETMLNEGLLTLGDSYLFINKTRNEKTQRRFESCTPVLTEENMKEAKEHLTAWVPESNFYIEKMSMTQYWNMGEKDYYLVLNTVGYPWEAAINDLLPIYGFSLMMVLLLVGILSKGLWTVYEKQIVLEKNRKELTDTIGHELKTPLGIIRTYSEGLKEHISEEKRDYYLEVIIDETAKMDELILEMLDLSKLESKAYTLKKETFSLNTLIQEVLKNKERLFENQAVSVTLTTDGEWQIVADYKRMMQVINNLVINALLHTPKGGKIQILIEKGKVAIENEGESIPEDQLALIWDAFYKGDMEKERCERGTGLGLSIVCSVLELHKMPYGVTNTDLGVKFWFEFMCRK